MSLLGKEMHKDNNELIMINDPLLFNFILLCGLWPPKTLYLIFFFFFWFPFWFASSPKTYVIFVFAFCFSYHTKSNTKKKHN